MTSLNDKFRISNELVSLQGNDLYSLKLGDKSSLRFMKAAYDAILESTTTAPVRNFLVNRGLQWSDVMVAPIETSASGIAIHGTHAEKQVFSPDFVVKIHRREIENGPLSQREIEGINQARQEMVHEYLIGMVTNTFRAVCPNFSLVLGRMYCTMGGDHTDTSLSNISFCTSQMPINPLGVNNNRTQRPVNLLVYESVKNPTSLTTYIEESILEIDGNNCRGLFTVLFQTLAALSLAEASFGWYHQDEHGGNILVSSIADYGSLEPTDIFTYVLPEKVLTIETDKIVSVIDYGRTVTLTPQYPPQGGGRTNSYKSNLLLNSSSPQFGKIQFFTSILLKIQENLIRRRRNRMQPDNFTNHLQDFMTSLTLRDGLYEEIFSTTPIQFPSGVQENFLNIFPDFLRTFIPAQSLSRYDFMFNPPSSNSRGEKVFQYFNTTKIISVFDLMRTIFLTEFYSGAGGLYSYNGMRFGTVNGVKNALIRHVDDILQQSFIPSIYDSYENWLEYILGFVPDYYTENDVISIIGRAQTRSSHPQIFTFERWFANLTSVPNSIEVYDTSLPNFTPDMSFGNDEMYALTRELFQIYGDSYISRVINSSKVFMCFVHSLEDVFRENPRGSVDIDSLPFNDYLRIAETLIDNSVLQLINFSPQDCEFGNLGNDFEIDVDTLPGFNSTLQNSSSISSESSEASGKGKDEITDDIQLSPLSSTAGSSNAGSASAGPSVRTMFYDVRDNLTANSDSSPVISAEFTTAQQEFPEERERRRRDEWREQLRRQYEARRRRQQLPLRHDTARRKGACAHYALHL